MFELLRKALENRIAELRNSGYDELIKHLQAQLELIKQREQQEEAWLLG